ncbi:MAG: hypothetical protein L0Y72_26430 [Gemmataceae bacterium]|nr:hypothetical protein [Gemmataceae bacterium]MCI0742585.1 hypothetical protein [Gemmataceae bacterium]
MRGDFILDDAAFGLGGQAFGALIGLLDFERIDFARGALCRWRSFGRRGVGIEHRAVVDGVFLTRLFQRLQFDRQ